jgi:surface protein
MAMTVRAIGRERARRVARGVSTRLALVAALVAAAITRVDAVTCQCATAGAACTHLTLVDSSNNACSLGTGTTLTGNVDLRYNTPSTFSISGVTTWTGDLTGGGAALTEIDLTGLESLDGTLDAGSYSGTTPRAVLFKAPNLQYANKIDIASTHTLSFPALLKVGIASTYTAGYTSSTGWSFQVDSSIGYSFPLLTTTKHGPRCTNSNPCTSASAFPELTKVEGDIENDWDPAYLPKLEEVTGNFGLYNTASVWYPLLKRIEGNYLIGYNENTDFTKLPPLLESVTGEFALKSYANSALTATEISIPSVNSIGSLYVNLGQQSASVTHLKFPALTVITGTFTTAANSGTAKVQFWATKDLTEIDLLSLTSYSALQWNVQSHDGTSSTPPATDTTPVQIKIPCVSGMSALFAANPFEYKYACPSGCNLCTSSSSGTPPPSATTVTSAQLTAAVAACFAESASGACQCASGCGVLSGPISSWSFTGTQLDLTSLFEAKTTFNQPIESWDVSAVTSMSRMFRNASSFNQPLAAWNTASVNDMTQMFAGATVFARDISSWDTSRVTAYADMFDGATAFNAKYTCDGPKCSGDPSTGLSQAQKAGIAVGCVVFGIALIVFFIMRRRRDARERLRAQLGIPPAGTPRYAPQQQPQVIVIQQS